MWSAVLFVREERLRLECNSRVTVSKWEVREGNVTSKVNFSHCRICVHCMNIFTLGRNQVFWITCQTNEKGLIAKYK